MGTTNDSIITDMRLIPILYFTLVNIFLVTSRRLARRPRFRRPQCSIHCDDIAKEAMQYQPNSTWVKSAESICESIVNECGCKNLWVLKEIYVTKPSCNARTFK